MAAWWGLTLLFASQVEICIPSCSGSSPRPRTEGSTVLGAVGVPRSEGREYSHSPGVVPFPSGSCFSSCRGACPLLPCLQPAFGQASHQPLRASSPPSPSPHLRGLLASASGPSLLLRAAVPPLPSATDPPLALLHSLREPLAPLRAALEAPRWPSPVLARGAPGGWIPAGSERCRQATGTEGWNGNGINTGLCHSAGIRCDRREHWDRGKGSLGLRRGHWA